MYFILSKIWSILNSDYSSSATSSLSSQGIDTQDSALLLSTAHKWNNTFFFLASSLKNIYKPLICIATNHFYSPSLDSV